jgi:hypothetical protein
MAFQKETYFAPFNPPKSGFNPSFLIRAIGGHGLFPLSALLLSKS